MNIVIPDPHPGRCINHRGDLRCLDYEGVPHVCTFPDPPKPCPNHWGAQGVYKTEKPKPWVKPGVEAVS